MWSSAAELYPIHIAPTQAPTGQVAIVEPQAIRKEDYRPVKPCEAPYEIIHHYYSRRVWVCS
tara:strand:- start:180 stop:365 length:186 start_codon:yes stop_codon:yes gene_type:complete